MSAYSTLITGREDGQFRRTHFNRRQSWEWSHPLIAWNLFFTILNFGVGLLGIGLFLLSGSDLRLRALFPFLLVLGMGLLVLRFTPFITLFG